MAGDIGTPVASTTQPTPVSYEQLFTQGGSKGTGNNYGSYSPIGVNTFKPVGMDGSTSTVYTPEPVGGGNDRDTTFSPAPLGGGSGWNSNSYTGGLVGALFGQDPSGVPVRDAGSSAAGGDYGGVGGATGGNDTGGFGGVY